MTSSPIGRALDEVPRTPLAVTPTPLLESPHLARHLGLGAGLWIKADAWTGFGLGGNKVRKLEYELTPERLLGVTHLITAGGPHSNHCRVTAAAAAHLGLSCTLVLNGCPDDPARGNALLHRILGAEIVTVSGREDRAPAMEERARDIERAGGRALLVPLGASTPRGSLGYARALGEIADQLPPGARPTLVVPSSSGGTLAGLILGMALLGVEWPVLAVSADDPAHEVKARAVELAQAAAGIVAPDTAGESVHGAARAVRVTDSYVGTGYGEPTPESEEA
ncbi:MAG: pyridoxal-phosphate dependent enzyme, partial [Gemmatimonadetes bacterium]|nr:pyridoxal-phosphate dependent enzyme [Gemmatimonadota bacterium]